jgi:hypothetical protein
MHEDRGRSEVLAKVKDLREKYGNVMFQEVKWNPRSWEIPQLAMFETQISMFTDSCQGSGDSYVIRRGDVIELSKSIEDVFIGAMIFGYGLVGYGASRVGRVIRENHDLVDRLNCQYEAAAEGPESSWNSHTKQHRAKYLGPAFATKFAYFAARHQEVKGNVPLIADLNTSWAMWWLAGIPRSVEQHDSYMEYVNLAHAWGDELSGDYGADEIERAIFELGRGMSKTVASRQ